MIYKYAFKMATRLVIAGWIAMSILTVQLAVAESLSKDSLIQDHINRGVQFGNEGDFRKAISEFQKVLELDPRNIHAYNNIGVAYFRTGDLDQAIGSYTKAIDLGIADSNMYFFRGLMYGKYKQEDVKAIEDYSKAIELQPNFLRAYLNRAMAYSFLKEHEKAIADYNKMVEIKSDEIKLVVNLRAKEYFQNGDYAKAWSDVERAKELGVNVDQDFIAKLQKASPR